MLPDAALRSIADNLAALRLDPVLHLKIIVAVVGPLMDTTNAAPAKETLKEAKPLRAALRQTPLVTRHGIRTPFSG